MSAIDLVAQLAAAGTPPELLAAVAQQLFAGEVSQAAIDARRSNDRDRKSRKSREVTGTHVNGAEVTTEPFPPLPPLKSSPDPTKITPPISPNPEDLSAGPTDPPLTKVEVIEAWQTRMVPQGFPPIRKMTGQRDRQLKARLRDSTLDEWMQAMSALERSAFCRGENDRGWRADFDFLLQPKSFTKLLEGAYDH